MGQLGYVRRLDGSGFTPVYSECLFASLSEIKPHNIAPRAAGDVEYAVCYSAELSMFTVLAAMNELIFRHLGSFRHAKEKFHRSPNPRIAMRAVNPSVSILLKTPNVLTCLRAPPCTFTTSGKR